MGVLLKNTTRQQMYKLLRQVREQTGVTTLHVTHSQEEARHLADIYFRVEDGQVTSTNGSNGSSGL